MLQASKLLPRGAVAVLALVLAVGVGGCDRGGSAGAGGTLRIDVIDDRGQSGANASRIRQRATLKGLVQFDAAGKVVPGLATSWRITADGRSVIFRLRDAEWSDGRRVTADEVVGSFRRLLGPGPRSPAKALLSRIENAPQVAAGRLPLRALGVTAPVKNVVEIRLSAPMPELLQVLALPDAVVQRAGRNPAVNGPFLEAA
ncbi:MAG: ABC transporter substrate-binding protein, partial [Polymorphobacter sp.]